MPEGTGRIQRSSHRYGRRQKAGGMRKRGKFRIDGIGLFRSEFLYMESDHFPTEEEQFNVYRQAAELLGERELTIRTLDIGG